MRHAFPAGIHDGGRPKSASLRCDNLSERHVSEPLKFELQYSRKEYPARSSNADALGCNVHLWFQQREPLPFTGKLR